MKIRYDISMIRVRAVKMARAEKARKMKGLDNQILA